MFNKEKLMYYVTTKNDEYTIKTSYSTAEEAKRFNAKDIESGELHLMSDGFAGPFEIDYSDEFYDFGRIRTHLVSNLDGQKAGNFLLYLRGNEEEPWQYSGISFLTLSDANKTLKSVLYRTFGELLVVERGPENIEDYDLDN
jgi:hypothetical protein